MKIEFQISDTFTTSLARLTANEQKSVKITSFDLQTNPASPGLRFHKIDKSRNPDFWSVNHLHRAFGWESQSSFGYFCPKCNKEMVRITKETQMKNGETDGLVKTWDKHGEERNRKMRPFFKLYRLQKNRYEVIRGNRLNSQKLSLIDQFGSEADCVTKTTVLGVFGFARNGQ